MSLIGNWLTMGWRCPLSPRFTRIPLSAIPIPDPHIEKNKVIKVYEGNDDETKLVEVEKDHFVRGTPEQIVKYKKAVENHQNKL